ncbi:hypothetical protein AZF37_01775 [endosymbiont 'TC1' of Trimyema compressum]|nr:hypothetical protein AZF37_01775 [endosymbiont 'TC1' of Trimyema compressum]
MEQLYETQIAYFTLLIKEMKDVIKMRHNIHNHLTIIDGFIENHQYAKLREYVSTWQSYLPNNQIKNIVTYI